MFAALLTLIVVGGTLQYIYKQPVPQFDAIVVKIERDTLFTWKTTFKVKCKAFYLSSRRVENHNVIFQGNPCVLYSHYLPWREHPPYAISDVVRVAGPFPYDKAEAWCVTV